MIHDTHSGQISHKQDGHNIYEIMKTMWLSRLSPQCLFYNIYIYIYIYNIYIYSPKQIYFHLSYNFRHFMISAIMYNSTGYEHIVQNDKFLSVIFIYCFNFTIYIYIYI